MNVFMCRKFKLRNQYCAFLKMEFDKTGKLYEGGCKCILKGSPRDDYRLIPDHDSSTGNVIYQRSNWSQPFNFGPSIIWGSLRPNDSGWFLDPGNIRPEEYNMHPLYVIHETNEPTTTALSNSTVLIPFGNGANTMLSSLGWMTQYIRGLENVDVCNEGLYGTYSAAEGMVIPKCIKEYTLDIPGWVNYTLIPSTKNRQYTFIVAHASKKEIAEHCIKWFGSTMTAVCIAEILFAIKSGQYIPMKDVLENHGISDSVRIAFMRETNTRINNIHRDVNLKKYYVYYKYLKTLPLHKNITFRANLINYLLNDPILATIDVNKPDAVTRDGRPIFSPRRRYWWLVEIIKDAYRGHKKTPILNVDKLPNWLLTMLTVKTPVVEEKEKAPASTSMVSILKETSFAPDPESKDWARKLKVFGYIVKAGQRWTTTELKLCWIEFCRTYDSKCPKRFWAWIESLRLATNKQIMKLLDESKQFANLSKDDPDVTVERAFAFHLLEAREGMEDRNNFEVKEPLLQERWHQITPKGRRVSEEGVVKGNPEDIMWDALERVYVLDEHKGARVYKKMRTQLIMSDPDTAKMLISDFRSELQEELQTGTHIDGDDIGRDRFTRIVDIDGNEELYGEEDTTWEQE